MNELINITTQTIDNTQVSAVSARDLHSLLDVESKFADWIKNRITKYNFEENVDYLTLSKILENGGKSTEYYITLDMAKELSMVENNEKGKQARKYFIEVEKNNKPKNLTIYDYAKALVESQDKLTDAIRTKAYISDKKTATALGKLGGTVKALNSARRQLHDLATETLQLDDARTCINMLVRAYAEQKYDNNYQVAWANYYRMVQPRLKTNNKLKDWDFEQLNEAYRFALSMCKFSNVNIDHLCIDIVE